jgi:hypothetical protein
MNAYEERKQARIDGYYGKANKAQTNSNQLIDQSGKMMSAIPLGQPILVGHHSERGDRSYRSRANNKLVQGVDESNKADYYLAKAQAAENNTAISSDDPDAIAKLTEKLLGLQNHQAEMKKANTYYKKHKTMKGYEDISPDYAAELDKKIKSGYSWNQQPFPSYLLTNNNANMRRIKSRIDELKKRDENAAEQGWEFEGGRVEMNTEFNRIQIFFDEKPDEGIRAELKANGFRWAPSVEAWQRQLSANGLYALKRIKSIRPTESEAV